MKASACAGAFLSGRWPSGRRFIGTMAFGPRSPAAPRQLRENVMKTLVSTIALLLALAVTGPAFAGDVSAAKNQADCEKAGGIWNAEASTCSEKGM